MSPIGRMEADAPVRVGVTEVPEGLAAIHHPACAAAVWRREPLARFQTWIDALAPEHLPRAHLVLRHDMVRDAVAEVCEARGTPGGPERALLIDDTAALAHLFAELTRATYLRLRFEIVRRGAARPGDAGAVPVRLVCTYRGTGTQYAITAEGGVPRRVFTVPTGAPILLRRPAHPGSGFLHRSPP
ncbi:MAG: DUF1826 domain-containing protein, partial [Pseudomonadota bacterium]